MDFVSWFNELAKNWGPVSLRVLVILVVTALIWTIVRSVIGSINIRIRSRDGEKSRRLRTSLAVTRIVLGILIFTLLVFMVLSALGVQLGPMLATAGVAGIAIGLGAQSLVKDSVNGFFMMVENRIRVGDWVEAAGDRGTVEAITLLDVMLRDMHGQVHIIPNGAIDVATNATLHFSCALVDLKVAYKEDADKVMKVLAEEAKALCEADEWKEKVLEAPQVYGIIAFGESGMEFRVRIKTRSGEHWAIERELRMRFKRRFDKEGIEIPFPHRTVYLAQGLESKAIPPRK